MVGGAAQLLSLGGYERCSKSEHFGQDRLFEMGSYCLLFAIMDFHSGSDCL
jgi:hypothetical protein